MRMNFVHSTKPGKQVWLREQSFPRILAKSNEVEIHENKINGVI